MTVIKILPHAPDPLSRVKCQIVKFRNNSVICQKLLKLRMQTEEQ